MTFKEFFQKKKIDLALLGSERPQLLKEFQKHFEAMGEKSFDHTKKYWFNKLRKSYPLKEEPAKPATPAVLPSKTVGEKASEGEAPSGGTEPSGSGAPKPALGFKPRFKARKAVAPSKPAGEKQGTEQEETGSEKQLTAAETQQTEHKEQKTATEQQQTSLGTQHAEPVGKPAYKPRFKAGITRNIDQTPGEKIVNETGVSASSANKTGTQGNASAPPGESKEKTAEKEEKAQKKSPAPYKPRFRPGITPKQKE